MRDVAGPQRRELTRGERQRLRRLGARIESLEAQLATARTAWAALVEEAGQAAVARELGITRQAVASRLRAIRTRRGRYVRFAGRGAR
jgi:hypothetical protein